MSVQSLFPERPGKEAQPLPRGTRARELRADEADYQETLFSLFQKHLVGTRANSQKTVKIAMGAIHAFFGYVGRPPWEAVESDLSEFLTHKVEVDKIHLGRQATYICYLRAFQNYLLDSVGLKNEIHRRFGVQLQRFVTQENAIVIKRKRHERLREIRPLSGQQCNDLIQSFDEQIALARQSGNKAFKPLRRDKVMVMLMLLTGLRVEELVTLKVTDWMSDSSQPQFGPYALLSLFGKGRKRRVVRLFNPMIREVMDWYMQDIRPGFLQAKTDDPSLLFFSERGRQLCTEQVRRMLRDNAALAGIPFGVRPHMLRHTYATQMKDIIGPEALQRQLGHEHLSTTLSTYYHPNPEKIGYEIAEAINKFTHAIDSMTAGIVHEDYS